MTRTPVSRGQKVKGQGQQAALLSAALTRKAAAAISVGTYSAWESTAMLRLFGEALRLPCGRRGRGHIVSPRAQLVVAATAAYAVCLINRPRFRKIVPG